jgi:hypothetical protein
MPEQKNKTPIVSACVALCLGCFIWIVLLILAARHMRYDRLSSYHLTVGPLDTAVLSKHGITDGNLVSIQIAKGFIIYLVLCVLTGYLWGQAIRFLGRRRR